MNSYFNFTHQEWVASMLLWIVALTLFIVNYIEKPSSAMEGFSVVSQSFKNFEQQQLLINDSLQTTTYPKTGYQATIDTPRKKLSDLYQIRKIELNSADTSDIKTVPLFGSKRAAALVKYRDQLGGLHSLEQLQEVFVLQSIPKDLLEKYFTIDTTIIIPININSADYKTMVAHPYLDSYLTKTLINHREKNGKIMSFQEIQEVTHAYLELIEKLKPYIIFNNNEE